MIREPISWGVLSMPPTRGFLGCALAVAAVAGLGFASRPVFASNPITVIDPQRPVQVAELHVALGVFSSYKIQPTSYEIQMDLALIDPATGAVRVYVLSDHTTVNGTPFQCASPSNSTY